MGKLILIIVLFFTYLMFSVLTESDKVEKDSIYKLLPHVIVKFINVIHSSTYWQHGCKVQDCSCIISMGFVHYRKFNLMYLLDTNFRLLPKHKVIITNVCDL